MDDWLRQARGLLGVGVTWAALWAVIGGVIGALVGIFSPDGFLWSNPILEWAMGMGVYGFLSGMGFGKLLSLAEGRKRLGELSLGRVALWGVLGSAAIPLVFAALGMFSAGTTFGQILGAMGVTAFLGGISAPGAVALARRAELSAGEDPELLGR